jgi:hypothetical protein
MIGSGRVKTKLSRRRATARIAWASYQTGEGYLSPLAGDAETQHLRIKLI